MEFVPFPKIARLSRDVTISEKIDGSNASVTIVPMADPRNFGAAAAPATVFYEPFYLYAASRTRWIIPEADNFGFAAWVRDNAAGLVQLGEGTHFGEWWGRGIQRGYDQAERHFSLFNTKRWGTHYDDRGRVGPCRVVPTLYQGKFHDDLERLVSVREALSRLYMEGSVAAPGFERPEGIIIYHSHSNTIFKTTLEHDDKGKDHGS